MIGIGDGEGWTPWFSPRKPTFVWYLKILWNIGLKGVIGGQE
jgi:hypothetical protein